MSFICPYCKKEYETPIDLANCIIKCDQEIKKKTKQEHDPRLAKEKQRKVEELQREYNAFTSNLKNFEREYGELVKLRLSDNDERCVSLSYLYRILGI